MVDAVRDWQPDLDATIASEYMLLIDQASSAGVSFTAWNCFRIEESAYINASFCTIFFVSFHMAVCNFFFYNSGSGDHFQLRPHAATISTERQKGSLKAEVHDLPYSTRDSLTDAIPLNWLFCP